MSKTSIALGRGISWASLSCLLACGGSSTQGLPVGPPVPPPPPPAPAQLTAFVDANVLPMESEEEILAGHTVLVGDERIVEVGPDGSVSLEGATVIDVEGRYLLPGLIDMHVHNISSIREEREEDKLLFIANGVTTIREMWGSTSILEERRRVADGEILGPTHLVASQGLDGPGGPWNAPPVNTVQEALDRVEQHVAVGYDYIKVYNRLAPDVYQAVIGRARARGIPVVGHVPRNVGIEAVLTARQRTLEHFIGVRIDASSGVPGDPLDMARVRELASLSEAAGVWHTPTIAVNGLSVEEVAATRAGTELPLVSRGMRVFFENGFHNGLPSDVAQREKANMQAITREVFEAGGGLLVGTDAGFGWMIPGFSMHDELADFVEAGVPEYETLKAATSNAALAAGRGDLGRIVPGVQADLVLVDGNPLDDISVLRTPVGVMVRGTWLTAAELQSLIAR